MRPLVSVIVPTRNRLVQLREALESLLAQYGQHHTFELEIVVVDDASDDDTSTVEAMYPVRYVRHPVNRGLAEARNTGIQVSQGQYVAFLDDDDVWLPNKLETQVPVIESTPDVGLVYSPFVTELDGQSVGPAHAVGPSGFIFEELLLNGNFIGVMTVLVRRAILDDVGGFRNDRRGLEDYDLWLRLARRVPFKFVPGAVAIYRASSRGMLVTDIASGVSREIHRRVVHDALQMVPTVSTTFRDAVMDRMELGNFHRIRDHLRGTEQIAQMSVHLCEYPRLVRYADVRKAFARIARAHALASDSPLQQGTAICERLQLPGDTPGTRRLLGAVWVDLAIGLLLAGEGRFAMRAISRGIRYDPSQLIARLLPSPREWLRVHPAARSRIRRLLRRPVR